MTDLKFFSDTDLDTVVGLLFELAGQLHEERAQRIELEARLEAADLLDPTAPVPQEIAVERSREQLASSMERLMRIMQGSGPPEHPLRAEAREDSWAVNHG